MNLRYVVLGLIASTGLWAAPAMADKAAYCQAYARDFSDARAADKSEWQHKYDIALDACLGSGKKAAAAQAAPAAPKVVAAKPAPKPAVATKAAEATKPVVAAKPETEAVVQPAAADAAPKLVVGSPEWNDYCNKKYTSFNAKTGMYLSHTGVSRHCLVTKDFKG